MEGGWWRVEGGGRRVEGPDLAMLPELDSSPAEGPAAAGGALLVRAVRYWWRVEGGGWVTSLPS